MQPPTNNGMKIALVPALGTCFPYIYWVGGNSQLSGRAEHPQYMTEQYVMPPTVTVCRLTGFDPALGLPQLKCAGPQAYTQPWGFLMAYTQPRGPTCGV